MRSRRRRRRNVQVEHGASKLSLERPNGAQSIQMEPGRSNGAWSVQIEPGAFNWSLEHPNGHRSVRMEPEIQMEPGAPQWSLERPNGTWSIPNGAWGVQREPGAPECSSGCSNSSSMALAPQYTKPKENARQTSQGLHFNQTGFSLSVRPGAFVQYFPMVLYAALSKSCSRPRLGSIWLRNPTHNTLGNCRAHASPHATGRAAA